MLKFTVTRTDDTPEPVAPPRPFRLLTFSPRVDPIVEVLDELNPEGKRSALIALAAVASIAGLRIDGIDRTAGVSEMVRRVSGKQGGAR